MNKESIKQEIRDLMDVINDQQALVLSHHGKIPQIEMDILMGNIRKAYELFLELNKQEHSPQQVSPPIKYPGESLQPEELIAKSAAPAIEEKVIIPEVTAEAKDISGITETLAAAAANVTPPMQQELIVASVDTPVAPAKAEVINEAVIPQAGFAKERVREFAKPSAKITATASLFDDAPTIAGQFQGATTVRDKIASTKEDKSVAEKLQQHPVSDLKKSIGINEKFAFINELFNGDPDGYNNAIGLLNSCNNINEAMDVLSNSLAVEHNWSNNSTSFLQLKNLLERRFSA